MKNMEIDFKDYEQDAKKLTTLLMRKAWSRGNRHITKDEIYSDVLATWVACREGFDPERGVTFRTYFCNSVMMNYGTYVRRRYDPIAANAIPLDAPHYDDEGDAYGSLSLEDEGVDIEEQISKREIIRKIGTRFPLLARFLELSAEPPEDLMAEIKAAQAQYELACERGVSIRSPATQLTPTSLHQIFDLNWRQRQELTAEMVAVAKHL